MSEIEGSREEEGTGGGESKTPGKTRVKGINRSMVTDMKGAG